MIVRDRPNWFGMMLVWRGSVLPVILPQLVLTAAFATLVTLLLQDDRAATRTIVHATIAFTHALRHQLRDTDPLPDLGKFLPADFVDGRLAAAQFRPALILLHIGELLGELRRSGRVDPILVAAMERHLDALSDVLGACERLAGTPLPFTYSVILHRTIYLYCFLLPFGLVDSIGVLTPLIVAFLAYTFYALEALSDQLEEPFGTDANDLALDGMATTIETTLREMLGETDLPEPVKPVNYVLT